jgi:hypothetical protein
MAGPDQGRDIQWPGKAMAGQYMDGSVNGQDEVATVWPGRGLARPCTSLAMSWPRHGLSFHRQLWSGHLLAWSCQ